MEGRIAEHTTQRPEQEQPDGDRSLRFILYALATAVAVAATTALAIVLLVPGEDDGNAAPQPAEAAPANGFVFFSELHATVLVSPGTAGENTIDVAVATHDGSDPEVAALTVSVSDPAAGTALAELPAEPVEGAPGTFRVSDVSIPTAGDWQFALTVAGESAAPETQSTLIPIGEPAGS
jgi:hypothetical protein